MGMRENYQVGKKQEKACGGWILGDKAVQAVRLT
ncbi:hypothetical protein SAMN04488122_1938 [Chitinophaga arvensicola]|uniref:Uncharacterized protein n=1 Tax=Chitinophaga arvensicola TaxID=29529 RepID=A0A1I0QZ16_9BACT|nr:hypothetical protein SAMN04488122_1938 [Chitinophaga arvensicola]